MPRRPATTPTLTPAALLRLNRRKRWARVAVAVVVLAFLVLLDRGGLLLARGGDLERYDGRKLLVDQVIDGDTLDVLLPDDKAEHPGTTTRVRLWGVDTPETAKPARFDEPAQAAEPFADEAWQFARQLAENQPVTLRLEPSRERDRYGRLLAHVELPDGTLLAERLLAAGLAEADERWPHQQLERFSLLADQARRDGLGLWSR